MSAGFTPGPWDADTDSGNISQGGDQIASAWLPRHRPNAISERAANAHLIAAAPDGYALAEWIERHWSNQDMNHADFRTQAAIMALEFLARARGEQP